MYKSKWFFAIKSNSACFCKCDKNSEVFVATCTAAAAAAATCVSVDGNSIFCFKPKLAAKSLTVLFQTKKIKQKIIFQYYAFH